MYRYLDNQDMSGDGRDALATLGFRGGIEGVYDSARARSGDVRPSDVGQPPRG